MKTNTGLIYTHVHTYFLAHKQQANSLTGDSAFMRLVTRTQNLYNIHYSIYNTGS